MIITACQPRSRSVGYDSIRAELAGELALGALVALVVVKLVIWAVALGSGTSGGILAPLLIIGGAAGAIAGQWLPGAGPAVWALLGMAAALAGVTRSPLTSLVFALELTHDQNVLLPLLVSCMAAYAISVLVLRRSILTEKVARRGFHVMREYAVDPLEALLVGDVMATNLLTTGADRPLADLARLADDAGHRRQRLYPVVDRAGRLLGVIGRRDVSVARAGAAPGDRTTTAASTADAPATVDGSPATDDGPATVASIMRSPVVAFPDETLRGAAERMVATRLGVLPVVERDDPGHLLGLVDQFDLLRARDRLLTEERSRQRVLRLRLLPSIRRIRPRFGD